MPTVLLDTDVVSFLLKGDTRATTYMPLLTGNRLALSFTPSAEPVQDVMVAQGRHFSEVLINQVL